MTILHILNELAATTKRLEKEAILKREKNNKLLKTIFLSAYNPDIIYWIQKHPETIKQDQSLSLDVAIQKIIDNIASRKLTGNAAIDFYREILSMLHRDDATVLRRIIDRDLKCGIGVPTINKIWKGLVPTYKLMLAESNPDKLEFPQVVVQPKYDGLRLLITHTEDGEIIIRTRNGNHITSLNNMHEELKRVISRGETWDGEGVCYDGKDPMDRKKSNGILNKAIRGTISPTEAETIRFLAWDIIDQNQIIPYEKRLQTLYLRLKNLRDAGEYITIVKAVETYKVETLEQVENLFKRALDAGQEGVIAKNLKSVWQPKRVGDLCKFKAELTADLVVVDWEEGKGRNQNRLGALVCESSDGKVRVNIGSGFSDIQRDEITVNNSIGKIIEVMYNARISKKNNEIDSLYLARFLKFRHDKTEANSSEEIV